MSKLLDLLLPTPCLLCSKLGKPLCDKCKENLPISLIPIEISGVQGFAISEYSHEASILINAIKEKGITSLSPILARLIASLWPVDLEQVVFIPIPSSPANNKKRGFSHTALLAKALAREVAGSTSSTLLSSARGRKDQVGLSGVERAKNLGGAFRAELRGFRVQGRPIVLVDDVLTSGASMRAAIETLVGSGVEVASFCVFARA